MSSHIDDEIAGYVVELNQLEQQLDSFKIRVMEDSVLHADANVALMAVHKLRSEISVPQYAKSVNLDRIVKLTDDIADLTMSTSRLLSRIH